MPAPTAQTTLIPAGGASIVELTVLVPGWFLLVDHRIVRAMEEGALGVLDVAGAGQVASSGRWCRAQAPQVLT